MIYYIVFTLIFLIALMICTYTMIFKKDITSTEHFQWDPKWVGKTSLDCYKETPQSCMEYSNCGLCLKDGYRTCIPGDEQGPFFKEDCDQWMHTNYYDRYIFGEKVTTIRPPWSRFYSEYEAWYPNPRSRATLM